MSLRHVMVRSRPIGIRPAILACIALVISLLPIGLSAHALATSSSASAIVVVSHPRMAAVLIDGIDSGLSTPATITSLRPGAHRLSLVIPGFDPWKTTITMPPTGKLNIVAGLKVTSDPADAVTVTVTTDSDASNGDVSSIVALIANPGPDGVSFREALLAANNTTGAKVIKFAPALKGSTIAIGGPASTGGPAPNFLPQLLSGDTSIIGDIDGDGLPDITLDGRHDNSDLGGWGISVWSSGNRVTGLRFVAGGAILFCPGGDWSGPAKTLTNNQVLGNSIVGTSGIYIGPLGLIGATDPVLISNLTWDQFVIAGNDIVQAPVGIFLYAGSGTSHDNLISNVTIAANWIKGTDGSGGNEGIGLWAADANSIFQGVPGPVRFADHNQLQNITIERNHIDNMRKDGVFVGGASQANSFNTVSDVHVLSNQIRMFDPNLAPANAVGIMMTATDPGSGDGRTASGNILRRIDVRGNTITNAGIGIRINTTEDWGNGVGDPGSWAPKATTANVVKDVVIANNVISLGSPKIGGRGIVLGVALMYADPKPAFNNVMKSVTVSGNQLRDGTRRGIGIQVTVGISGPGRSVVSHNTSSGLVISKNVLRGWGTAVLIATGQGPHATANNLTGKSVGNVIVSSTTGFRVVANDAGASRNSIHFTRR